MCIYIYIYIPKPPRGSRNQTFFFVFFVFSFSLGVLVFLVSLVFLGRRVPLCRRVPLVTMEIFSHHGCLHGTTKTAREGVNGKDYDGLRYPRYPLAHWWTAPTACLGSVPGDRTRYNLFRSFFARHEIGQTKMAILKKRCSTVQIGQTKMAILKKRFPLAKAQGLEAI